MNTLKKPFILFIALMFTYLMSAQTKWIPDTNHTKIRFTAVHNLISEVEGEFRKFDFTIISNSEDFDGAKVDFSAEISSISTLNDIRDNHLKSDDFFNAEKYPELTFNGSIEKMEGKYYLIGDLTIRDVTKPIKFDVKYNGTISLGEKGKKAGMKITGSIDRFDYGLKWNKLIETGGGLVVSNEIDITCNVELDEVQP